MKHSNKLETRLLKTLIEVQPICKKVLVQFFRTTTGIQPGPNAFDKSRFIMAFLTILEITEISCCFKLVLEGKTGKEIPESSRLEI